jgi:hypothetical protein
MTFADFLNDHGTKILGGITTMIGAAQLGLSSLVSAQVITAGQGVLWQFLLGILAAGFGGVTIARGVSTGAVYRQAKAVLADAAAKDDEPPTPNPVSPK